MGDTELIDGLIAGLKTPNFIKRRKQIMVKTKFCDWWLEQGKILDFNRYYQMGLGGDEMFTHRYIVLGITEGGYVDRLAGLRGTDSREICERALEGVEREGKIKAYRQLILISIGRDGEIGESLQVNLHRIEPTPPIPQPKYTLQPVHAYFG